MLQVAHHVHHSVVFAQHDVDYNKGAVIICFSLRDTGSVIISFSLRDKTTCY